MFVAGISIYAALIFSSLSFLVAVPSAIKVFNWTATLYKGSISFEAPMLFALGFVVLFTFGGMAGLFLATLGMDMHVHDTYFVIAHFHFIMVGGMVSAYMGGLALLVAQDDRPNVLGMVVAAVGDHHLRRLFSHVSAAVRVGLQRHAPPLPYLRARIPGLECVVNCRLVDPGRRLSCCHCSTCLMRCATATDRRTKSLACDRPGMADAFASAARQFRGDAGRRARTVRILDRKGPK